MPEKPPEAPASDPTRRLPPAFDPTPDRAPRAPRRGGRQEASAAWVLAAIVLLWAVGTAPLALGERTFFLRDVFSTHLPFKAFGAEQLREGSVPAFNPTWGLGQPFRGNPNALPFYPGNVLYLFLPFWSAFNLHYALHWLLALFTMRALARALGQGPAAALLAGIAFAGSGWMLSALTFYNLLAVAAWWPLVLLGAARGGSRGIALGGTALGLAVLGGEPVTAVLGMAPAAVAALSGVSGRGWRRGALVLAGIAAVGAVLALPQIVATLRVLPFTFRGGHGLFASQVRSYALDPARLVELVVPLPWGWPFHLGRFKVWAVQVLPTTPYFLSLYFGIPAFALALPELKRRRAWAALALGGLALAWLGAFVPDLLSALSRGLFRFPEKFLFWTALAFPLLAGWGLERRLAARHLPPKGGRGRPAGAAAGRRDRRWPRGMLAAGALLLVLAAALGAAAPALLAAVRTGLLAPNTAVAPPDVAGATATAATAPPDAPDTAQLLARTHLGLWVGALAAAGVLLLAAAWSLRRGWGWALPVLNLLAVAQLAPLVQTDATAPYREPSPWARRLGSGAAVFNSALAFPPWHGPAMGHAVPDGGRQVLERVKALDLDPAAGVPQGLTYPLAPDLEGLHSPLTALLLINLPRLDWPARVKWFRTVGLDAAVLFEEPPPGIGLTLLDRQVHLGRPAPLYGVEEPAPAAWWPERARAAPGAAAALERVSFGGDPLREVVVSGPVDHRPGGEVSLLAWEPGRIAFRVRGAGGVAVLCRAYQPLYRARSEGDPLPTLAVNLHLLGVVVPPGEHEVEVTVPARPEAAAGALSLLALAGLAGWAGAGVRGAAWRRSRSRQG